MPRNGLDEGIVCERGFSPGLKPMIYDRVRMALVHYFPFGGVTIGEAGLLVLSWWYLDCCYKK
jgi:hypothetical protein